MIISTSFLKTSPYIPISSIGMECIVSKWLVKLQPRIHSNLKNFSEMNRTFLCLFLLGCFSYAFAAPPGVQEREILLGSHQPLSGIAASFGDISKAAEVYFRFVNDQGGLHGRKINYRYMDDGFQPIRTKSIVKKLVLQEKVFLIFNGIGTAPHQSISSWLQNLKVPDFFVGSGDSRWTEPTKPTVFGFQPTPRIEGQALGKYLLQTHPHANVVVWHQDSIAMREANRYLSGTLLRNNITVRAVAHPVRGANPEKDLERIRKMGPQVVVLFGSPFETIRFLKARP